jgi:hypothetical protein
MSISNIHLFKEPEKKYVSYKEAEVNDKVFCTGDSGFCDPSYEKVSKITQKYDEDTGKPYRIIHYGKQMFDGRDGCAINSPMAYYLAE